jgi:hypothetical protein
MQTAGIHKGFRSGQWALIPGCKYCEPPPDPPSPSSAIWSMTRTPPAPTAASSVSAPGVGGSSKLSVRESLHHLSSPLPLPLCIRLGKRLGRRSALDGSDWLLTSRAGETGVRLLCILRGARCASQQGKAVSNL